MKDETLKIINWRPKAGFDLTYQITKGEWLIFFDLQKSLQQDLLVKIDLIEPEADVLILGIFNGQTKESFPWQLTIHHWTRETKAKVLIKGVLRGEASTDFKGLIKIDPQAQGVESYLEHHTLMLSPDARSKVIPSLEIEANQVQASHASTTHYLNPEELFYLLSRGLDQNLAEDIIVGGFIAEVINLKSKNTL